MKKYKQLTSEQRYQIYGLKQAGLKQSRIAEKVGVDKSTISREFRRNKGHRGWRPKQAQALRDERKQACINGRQFSSDEWAEVERLIRADLSSEQAADRLALEGRLQISHEAIYRHIYVGQRDGSDVCRHLRGQKPYASVMRAGKSGGVRSRTASALMNARRLSTGRRALEIGRGTPSSARITKADWSRWPRGNRAMCWPGIYAANMPMASRLW